MSYEIDSVWCALRENRPIHCSMGSPPLGVQCRPHHRTPRASILLSKWISSPSHYLMASNHSRHGLPLLVSPSIVQNITSFTSLLSLILHMHQSRFGHIYWENRTCLEIDSCLVYSPVWPRIPRNPREMKRLHARHLVIVKSKLFKSGFVNNVFLVMCACMTSWFYSFHHTHLYFGRN